MIPSFLASIAVAALLNSVHAIPTHLDLSPRKVEDGINDRGSSKCWTDGNEYIMDAIQKSIDLLNPGNEYATGQQIVCQPLDWAFGRFGGDGFCASLCENTAPTKVEASTKDDDEFRNGFKADGVTPKAKTTFGDLLKLVHPPALMDPGRDSITLMHSNFYSMIHPPLFGVHKDVGLPVILMGLVSE
ncbi:MAG: hypothetical protein Q9169_005745 [Polycauliona sp. 2 TL-2023]